MAEIRGTVLAVNGNKELVLVEGKKYYVLKSGVDSEGDVIDFNEKDALIMPSYMFAIAAMAEPDLDATLNDIKGNWFKYWNK